MRSGGLWGGGPVHAPDAFERFDDTKAGGPGLFGGDEDVARVQRAVANARRPREIDRAGQLREERQHGGERRRRVVPHRDVERLGRDIFLGADMRPYPRRRRQLVRRLTDGKAPPRRLAPARPPATAPTSGVTSRRNALTATRRSRVVRRCGIPDLARRCQSDAGPGTVRMQVVGRRPRGRLWSFWGGTKKCSTDRSTPEAEARDPRTSWRVELLRISLRLACHA